VQLDIKPVHFEGLSCFDDIIVTLALHNKVEYRRAFADSWGFEFEPEGKDGNLLLGNRIRNSIINYASILSQDCNMTWANFDSTEPVVLFNYVKGYLAQGIAIGICIDSFWCPWLQGRYQRVNGVHYCLAIGIDEDNNFYCLDPALNLSVSALKYNDFINGCKYCIKYDFVKNDRTYDYLKILNESIEKLNSSNFLKRIRDFAYEFKDKFDFSVEYQNFNIDVWYVLIDRNLRLIAAGRTLYSVFLDLVSEKFQSEKVSAIKIELQMVASKWNKIRGVLTKSYYSGYNERVKEKVYNALIEVSNIQEDLVNRLYQCCHDNQFNKNENILPITKVIDNFDNSEIIALELENFVSNKAFAISEFDSFKANLTGSGLFFISNGLENQHSIQVEEMNFRLPKLNNQYDNISCSGEVIAVEKSIYYSIMFLGCSEHGDFIEEVIIQYENGETLKIPISFSDCWRKPLFNESIAWSGPGGRWTNDEFEPHTNIQRIFAREEIIREQKLIESIKLPECPNMHIFAISLRRLA